MHLKVYAALLPVLYYGARGNVVRYIVDNFDAPVFVFPNNNSFHFVSFPGALVRAPAVK